ncbi:hypothetical protein A2154_04075 [Candidatus Gottesmanbacteria bacterium RBG_16_43_7]|uniref:Serine aminopeptidase S33 domain-containing protein n=1 Tax=Candidatus Gottesmanbacteria bacterium RBG_16_43_7 TaxID=1798373 RepID=A0A1F5Z980_9BACT|nr:MAG: hypothetical protein A2154_04075 [Candidatus Gottesmanbacteria bacterium RBG_16_43_7]
MTIPYLRSRTYQSSLGAMNQISVNESFTAYTTTYNSDGLTINGYLTKPVGVVPPGGWPAIVFIHGYIPPSVYKTTENYVSYADTLSRGGFVVYKIDLRGNDSSEGEASGAYYSGDYIIDTLNAAAALSVSGFVNPDAIGLWGHSMGGNVVLRALVASPKIKAAVIWAGAVYTYADMQKYGIQDTSWRPPADTTQRQRRRNQLREKYGNYTPGHWFWEQVVPTNYLDGVGGALEIHHAVDDEVVNIAYSRNLMKIFDHTSIPHELYEYATGGHNLTGEAYNQAMERSIRFYRQQFNLPEQ